jgi:hypothetical protein
LSKPSWNNSSKTEAQRLKEERNQAIYDTSEKNKHKKIQTRGEIMHITTSACQVPPEYQYEKVNLDEIQN